MTDPLPELPADFGSRLAAARAYYGYKTYKKDLSRDAFAADLNASGASPSTIKSWETGGSWPDTLKGRALIGRLVELTGLPDDFFYGKQTTVSEQLGRIEETLQQMELAAQNRALEAEQRFDEVTAAIDQIRSRRQR